MALVQPNINGGGEIAALLPSRNVGSPTTTGTVPLWFTTQGSIVPMVLGRTTYSFFGSETWGMSTTLETSGALIGANSGHAAMSLGPGSAYLVIRQNQGALVSEPPTPMLSSVAFVQAPLGAAGPEQYAHVSRTQNRIAVISRPVISGGRQYDFGLYDTADGGTRALRTVLPDQATNTGTRAITDPNLARGCVVNDSFGVTFFYSTRLLSESTYQHWAQSYSTVTDTLSNPVLLSIPGTEDAVISCGGNVLHHVDMWRW
jgi:hypothetical protein